MQENQLVVEQVKCEQTYSVSINLKVNWSKRGLTKKSPF